MQVKQNEKRFNNTDSDKKAQKTHKNYQQAVRR